LEKFQRLFMPTYAPFEKIFVRGEGCCLFDEDDRRYLDFCAGIATINVGHCHPEVVRAIQKQAGKLMHISNFYLHRPELDLADKLTKEAFPGRLFLCQSGAEANETAIKLARKYFSGTGRAGRYKIITALGSFHGRTLGTIAATGQDSYRSGFEPIPEGFVHIPYNDLEAAAEAVDDETAAVMVEPIQGEGGVIVPDDGYLSRLRELCNNRGILLILDEVQTGFGRTGSLFAFQTEGIEPDILTMAKAFGGGLPLGGALAGEEVAKAFSPGDHATTFGGNPVTTAAANAVLRVIKIEDLLKRSVEMGARLMARLADLAVSFPSLIVGLRGRGLLVGLELNRSGREVVSLCQSNGLLITCVQGKVLRFTPPLTVTEEEIDTAVDILAVTLQELSGG